MVEKMGMEWQEGTFSVRIEDVRGWGAKRIESLREEQEKKGLENPKYRKVIDPMIDQTLGAK